MTKSKRKRRIFTPEFKRQAVALFEASGRTVAAAAAELDVHETVLRHWIDQLGSGAKAANAKPATSVSGLRLAIQPLRLPSCAARMSGCAWSATF